jgi:endonuclease/exonuclease/phosphatase family metal-dependent hydrolase
MKLSFLHRCSILILQVALFAGCGSDKHEKMRVLTYNIRFASFDSTDFSWEKRKAGLISQLHGYDFVGLQEVNPVQMNDILNELKEEYGYIYRTREESPDVGEGVPLLYNKQRWAVVNSSTFWLSDTPEIPGSNTWESAYLRVASYGLFASVDSRDTVLVINTHFDNVNQFAREKSAELIHRYFENYFGKIPIVLLGDFNVSDDNKVYSYIVDSIGLKDAWTGAGNKTDSSSFTYHGWKSDVGLSRIDYIFISRHFDVTRANRNAEKMDGIYPSDHFGVEVDLKCMNKPE